MPRETKTFEEVAPTVEFDLSQYDDDFASAEVEDRAFDCIPDGKYQVYIEKVELAKTKKTDVPMLKWTLRILAPQGAGRLLWRNNVIGSKENVKWLKADLQAAGLKLDKLSDLPMSLDKLIGVTLEVTKRTKGDNENIYINRRITISGADTSASDDIMPF